MHLGGMEPVTNYWPRITVPSPGTRPHSSLSLLCLLFEFTSFIVLFLLHGSAKQQGNVSSLRLVLKEIFFQLCYKDFFLVLDIALRLLGWWWQLVPPINTPLVCHGCVSSLIVYSNVLYLPGR